MAARHVGGGPGRIDEHEAIAFDVDRGVEPVPASAWTSGGSRSIARPVFFLARDP